MLATVQNEDWGKSNKNYESDLAPRPPFCDIWNKQRDNKTNESITTLVTDESTNEISGFESCVANSIVTFVRLCLDHSASSVLFIRDLESTQPCEHSLDTHNLWDPPVTNNLGHMVGWCIREN